MGSVEITSKNLIMNSVFQLTIFFTCFSSSISAPAMFFNKQTECTVYEGRMTIFQNYMTGVGGLNRLGNSARDFCDGCIAGTDSSNLEFKRQEISEGEVGEFEHREITASCHFKSKCIIFSKTK